MKIGGRPALGAPLGGGRGVIGARVTLWHPGRLVLAATLALGLALRWQQIFVEPTPNKTRMRAVRAPLLWTPTMRLPTNADKFQRLTG